MKDFNAKSDIYRISHNIKSLRLATGYNLHYIADLLEVSYQQVQKYERGTNRLPLDKLVKLRALYDVPYDIFFAGLEPDKTKLRRRLDDEDIKVIYLMRRAKDHSIREKAFDILKILFE